MWDRPFFEPTRDEVIAFKRIWEETFKEHCEGGLCSIGRSSTPEERKLLTSMAKKYPYLPEVMVALAAGMTNGETVEV